MEERTDMIQRLSIVLALCLCGVTAGADTLTLANGDELHGEIVEWAVDHVVIEHPQLGKIQLSLEQLDIDTGEPPSHGLFGTRFLRGWKRNINFGLNGEYGGSRTTHITAGMNFSYRDEFKRWLFKARYFFNDGDDDDADNNANVDLRRDWLFPGHRWFAFSMFRYQFDQFESWKHRTILSVGPGYHLVRREAHELDTRLGAAFTREFGERRTEKAEALFALDYTWTLSSNQSVTLSNQLFTEVRPNAGELRNLTLGEWKILLTQEPSFSLTLGAQNEYETDVEPEDQKNDLKYYLSVGLDF
jgi:putative salt-induced outer membrane protein YdiY